MTSRETNSDQDPSDAVLVGGAIGGDAGAFETLVRRYARPAYLVALAVTGVPADAEDALQDALVQAFEHLSNCRSPDRFAAWLIRIVRNRAQNIRRREVLRAGKTQAEIESIASSREWQEADGSMESPGDHTERLELRGHLLSALAGESELRRQVLLLHDLEDWTHREIAGALGISELMSRYHLSMVRRSMRARLTRYRQHAEDS